MTNNILIKADNKEGLQYLLDNGYEGKIDLVYIDPPFATGIDFTITKNRASTISKPKQGIIAYSDKTTGELFLQDLKERILLIHQLLSDNGSFYLHIDYKIGHYVKVMLDSVFGIENFKNDITRIKCNPKNFKRVGYGNIKDLILFYTKTDKPIWNEPKEKYTEKDIERLFPKKDKIGRRYTTVPIHAPGETANGKSNQLFKGLLPPEGRHWRTDVDTLLQWDKEGLIEWSSNGNPRKIIYANEQEGKRVQDIWEYKDPPYPTYPTEKNAQMLDLIIKTSSNADSIVLDAYCGSGTTLKAAHVNNRAWIGIDQSDSAINACNEKLLSVNVDFFIGKPEFDFIDLKRINEMSL